jgi:hypothetical protein
LQLFHLRFIKSVVTLFASRSRTTLFRSTLLSLLMTACGFALLPPGPAQPSPTPHQPRAANAPANSDFTVYVSDFDLDVVPAKPPRSRQARTSPASSAGRRPGSPSTTPKAAPSAPSSRSSRPDPNSDSQEEETPADRANALVRIMSENLASALNEAGYTVRRLPAGTPLPKTGFRIRGVFAEADEENRARRLLVGGEPVSPNILLFVGVNNLSQPEQPLYELAYPPIPDSRHGPVITVTSYAPAARFELSRDPADDEFKKIATQIAADLTALLNANPLLTAQ